MTKKINIKKDETNNNVPKNNTLKSFNANSLSTL